MNIIKSPRLMQELKDLTKPYKIISYKSCKKKSGELHFFVITLNNLHKILQQIQG